MELVNNIIMFYLIIGAIITIWFMSVWHSKSPKSLSRLKRINGYIITCVFLLISWPWLVYNIYYTYKHKND
jgi:hypothetical protein